MLWGTILWRINSDCSITSTLFFILFLSRLVVITAAVCQHVGRNLLRLQITLSLCLISLLLHTWAVQYISKWSCILTDHCCRNTQLSWLREWQNPFGDWERGRGSFIRLELSEKEPTLLEIRVAKGFFFLQDWDYTQNLFLKMIIFSISKESII